MNDFAFGAGRHRDGPLAAGERVRGGGMKRANRNQYDTCSCGERKRVTSTRCRRCRDRDFRGRVSHHPSHCSSCGWILTGARQCPRCAHGASMTWQQVAMVFNHQNPAEPPVTPGRAKAIVQNIVYKLRVAVDRDTDVGRVLSNCLRDLGDCC